MPSHSQSGTGSTTHRIPRYSQHLDIREPEWQPKSCGVVAVGMVLAYWGNRSKPQRLLREALFLGAYVPGIGWAHRGLAELAEQQGFYGKNFDWFSEPPVRAFEKLIRHVNRYPVIASIHKQFKVENGGHLIVVTGIHDGFVFYHEPDSTGREEIERSTPIETFIYGWKRRIIVVKPRKLRKGKPSGTISGGKRPSR